jgi:hypothetical protein
VFGDFLTKHTLATGDIDYKRIFLATRYAVLQEDLRKQQGERQNAKQDDIAGVCLHPKF